MRRLWLQIYAAILAMLVAAFVAAGTIGWLARGEEMGNHLDRGVSALAAALPPEGDPRLAPELRALSEALEADLTLRDAHDRAIAAAGPEVPPGPPGWWHDRHQSGLRVPLRDGRTLGLSWRGRHGPPGSFFASMAAVAAVLAAGAWWVARRITRRLEVVQAAMRAWGDGDLTVRVPVQGTDEVAAVAAGFNTAAERIQSMVDANRRTLASVSHELRSPLARLRMALELLDAPDSPIVAEAVRDVEELDATVGELLQVGRMQAVGLQRREPVDLRALLDDEARHTGARVDGPPTLVVGDPTLLRRLVRNLLDNARRYATEVEANTTERGLSVADRGPGVTDPERIFEPFHRGPAHAEGRDGGVGLGLWLVREIARQHGGDVRWEAREGGGSRFVVTLGT